MSKRILDELEKDSIVIDEGIYSPGFHFLTVICVFLLVPIIYLEYYVFAIIPIAIALILLTTREVIEVEFNNRKYRDGFKFLGKVYGDWLPIPKIKYVSVVGRDLKSEGTNGIGGLMTPQMLVRTSSSVYSIYEIRLFNSFRKKINLVRIDDYDDAIIIAKKIANKLDEKLLDATVKPAQFIEV